MANPPMPGAAQWNGVPVPGTFGPDGRNLAFNTGGATGFDPGLTSLQGDVRQWDAPPTTAQTMAALSATNAAPRYIAQVVAPTSPYQQALAAQAYGSHAAAPTGSPQAPASQGPRTVGSYTPFAAGPELDPRTAQYLEAVGVSPLAYAPEGVKDRLARWAMLTPEERSRLSPEMCVAAYTYMMIAERQMPAPSDLTPQGQALKSLVATAERQDPMLALRLKQALQVAYAPRDQQTQQTQQNGQGQSMLSGSISGSVFT
ncbi:MAG: hypothetical protein IPK13_04805 [Deltaproteobacteria bacterium]|nr:hypothetical protein [Deltaproteobacteria bacterium]